MNDSTAAMAHENKMLRTQIANLQHELKEMKGILNPKVWVFPIKWELSPLRGRMLLALLLAKGRVLSKDHLIKACSSSSEHDSFTSTVICQLRGALRKADVGISILNKHGLGFYIPKEECLYWLKELGIEEGARCTPACARQPMSGLIRRE